MSFEFYDSIENIECKLCTKPAKVIYMRSSFGRTTIRYFCKECAKKHAIVRRDK